MDAEPLSRDEIAEKYFDQLQFDPYPVQEEALFAWFAAQQGVLVCAPTGTGKTMIAEAAMFEALHTGKTAYYTTPLIALTEQKFRELQSAAVKWGFDPTDVGLVTGNRRENPDAKVLVVVAEILFNRLLHREAFDFTDVASVVMDEFHSFADAQRGIVWEFSLGLLPAHVRTLLLSATVGNAYEFVAWLRDHHSRKLELVQSTDRKVPLTYQWVPDLLLTQQLEEMASGVEEARRTPALVFCFNREECWNVAEQVKGKKVLSGDQQARLVERLEHHDWSQGVGPKLKQLLLRGVGVHHAGVLPKYRRIVEDLFQQKLLSIAMCTETLAAGINLPARSVVMPTILKGPPGKKKVIEPSAAHQIFGRAGRPQFDTEGYVYALAHEDDVKMARWREQYDQIPEDTKDLGLRKAKKRLKKKMPKRRTTEQYWNETQFNKLLEAPPGKLYSRGAVPWRLLAHMLEASPEVDRIRTLVRKRLLDPKRLAKAQETLDKMLLTLWRAGYVTLEPKPTDADLAGEPAEAEGEKKPDTPPTPEGLFGMPLTFETKPAEKAKPKEQQRPTYQAQRAVPTPEMEKLHKFRGVHPLFGVFAVNQLGIANREERIQVFESVLEMPGSVARYVRVPKQDFLPPGPLATTRLDVQLLQLGLASAEELTQQPRDDDEERRMGQSSEERVWVLTLADKLRRMFDYDFPDVHDIRTTPVWAAGELLEYGGDFNQYITTKRLQKQEGVVFRHLLRLILLLGEFIEMCPPDTTEELWRGDLGEITEALVESCRQVDSTSTDLALEHAQEKPADEVE